MKNILNKSVLLLIAVMGVVSLGACGTSKDDITDKVDAPKETITTESQSTEKNDSLDIGTTNDIKNGNNPLAEDYIPETEPKWLEDKLYVIAANEIGEDRLENCAADATNVKFLITEPDEMNAWLIQYAILYRMQEQGYTNKKVMFVFYETRGDVGTKYLQTTYEIETLDNLDLNELSSYLELKEYAE